MILHDAGMVMLSSEVQPEKASALISSSPSGRTISFKSSQPEKAIISIIFTESGITIFEQ